LNGPNVNDDANHLTDSLNLANENSRFGAVGFGVVDCRGDRDNLDGWPASEAWFCLRTSPKQEHIAAVQLRQQTSIEVFLPRIRFQRVTRCGPAWVTEALFQNYLFAKFDLLNSLRCVQAARGVRGVVHFGNRWPTVPETAIRELRTAMDDRDLRVIEEDTLQPGDMVEIAGGAMHGLQAVVSRVMPSRQRAAVLLDFLGRQTTVELDRDQLIVAAQNRPRRSWMSAMAGTMRTAAAPI
jgi:transcriptional antiterminator RfaH